MLFSTLLPAFLLGAFSYALPEPRRTTNLPLSTKGCDIIDANGAMFRFAATNWPGHQEAMVPEGLQHASIRDIVSWFPKFGLNSVRLTFAIEMVDDYLDNNPNQTLEKSFVNSLGEANGTIVLNQILEKNPEFTRDTTRLEVWDAVAKELSRQGVIIHLDNHVSKAFWCCADNDGNGWFGENFFDVDKWKRGLAFMAGHAKRNWPTYSSIGLRNELRSATNAEPVDWYTWYIHMTQAADAVYKANPDGLIFFSGLSYDTYIDPIPLGKTLSGTPGKPSANKTAVFKPDNFAFKDKIVLEIHKYDFEATHDDCETFMSKWYNKGFQAVNPNDPSTKYLFPIVISEWGFIQNGTYWNQTTYAKCLVEMVEQYKVSWMHWELSGSFYLQTRPGRTPHETVQGLEEFWGLLDYNWSAVRSQVTLENSLYKMISALG